MEQPLWIAGICVIERTDAVAGYEICLTFGLCNGFAPYVVGEKTVVEADDGRELRGCETEKLFLSPGARQNLTRQPGGDAAERCEGHAADQFLIIGNHSRQGSEVFFKSFGQKIATSEPSAFQTDHRDGGCHYRRTGGGIEYVLFEHKACSPAPEPEA